MIGFDPHVEQTLRNSRSRIVVTGAGGWIGMATLEYLSLALGPEFTRRVACFGSSRRNLKLLDGTLVEQWPLATVGRLASAPSIVLHFAFLTKNRADTMAEADYVAANRAVDSNLLEALDTIGADAIFVASSGAAYRADDRTAAPAMRLYGELKLEQEERFAGWAARRGKRAVIARIFNISGPHINKHDSYALPSLILHAFASRSLVIRSAHRVERSYVAVRELMSLALAMLLDEGATLIRFDSGGTRIEVQEIAQIVARLLGPLPIDRQPLDPSIIDCYVGDDDIYQSLLAHNEVTAVPFLRQVIETIDFMAISQPAATFQRVATMRQSW